MAVTQTVRMLLTRWSDAADPFTRAQMDDDHAQLEARAAGFLRDTLGNRPAAAAANLGYIFEDTATGDLYWSTGAAWLGPYVPRSLIDAKGDLLVGSADNALVTLPVSGNAGRVLTEDPAEPTGMKWAVAGGVDRALIPGFTRHVADIATATQLRRIIETASAASAANIPVVMHRAGSIIGISAVVASSRTAGSLTFEVYKNGVATGLTVTIDGTNPTQHFSVQAAGLDTFVAGDRIDVRGTDAANTFAPDSNNYCEATVEVLFS